MTREEYERLLKSDYWKGYSYSLIKERNFTCEDCGRQFPNERNKLQVHHLVYRDVSPWSYRPDEVVVLCEECHKKRHGITDTSQQAVPNNPGRNPIPTIHSSLNQRLRNALKIKYKRNKEYRYHSRKRYRIKFRYVLYALLLLWFISIGWNNLLKNKPITDKNAVPISKKKESNKTASTEKKSDSPPTHKTVEIPSTYLMDEHMLDNANSGEFEQSESFRQVDESIKEPSTLKPIERKYHEEVVKRAQHVGVSTEGTTSEILERISYSDAVNRAQQAGVSTEGTTLEILERINQADVARQAQ